MKQALAACTNPRDRALILLMVDCGLRRAEVIGLDWDNVDIGSGVVTIVKGKKRFKAFCLNDNIPLMTALINDDGWDNLFIEQLKNLYRKGDVLLCLSVHGGSGKDRAGAWSQNLLKAMDYVNKNGGKTIGFSGFDGGAMNDIATVCVVVPFDATPHVEAFHVVLQHLIAFRLKEKIKGK